MTISEIPKGGYRADIDGLRALAVLAVVGFHLFPRVFPGGFVGVDVFFVISGFLITGIILEEKANQTFSFREFYARRIKRLFPSLCVVLLFCLIAGWFLLFPDEYEALGRHVVAGSGFFANYLSWKDAGYFDRSTELKPLQHLWSLAIEEQFYFIWPAALGLILLKKKNFVGVVITLLIGSFAYNLLDVHQDATRAFFSPFTRFWELMLGALLAKSPISFTANRPFDCKVQSVFGLVLILGSLFTFSGQFRYPGWWAILPTVGTLPLLSAGPEAWISRRLLSTAGMAGIGKISYPLYLWHWPLFSFASIIQGGRLSVSTLWLIFFSSLLLAWLTFRFIERPLRYGRPFKQEVLMPICAIFIVAGAGGWVVWKGGLSERAGIQANFAQYKFFVGNKFSKNNCEGKFLVPDINCSIGIPGLPPSVALIGDSHADRMFPGMAPYYRKQGENLIFLSGGGGCLPFYDVESFDSRRRTECRELTNQMLNFTVASPTIHTVILASRGPLYTTGSGFGGVDSHRWRLVLKGREGLHEPSEVFSVGLKRILQTLSHAGKEIIFVVAAPELGINPKTCIDWRRLGQSHQIVFPCAVKREVYDERAKDYLAQVKSILAGYPKAMIFEPSRYLCDNAYCWGIKQGKVFYKDNNHLSDYGSIFLSDKFAQSRREFQLARSGTSHSSKNKSNADEPAVLPDQIVTK